MLHIVYDTISFSSGNLLGVDIHFATSVEKDPCATIIDAAILVFGSEIKTHRGLLLGFFVVSL